MTYDLSQQQPGPSWSSTHQCGGTAGVRDLGHATSNPAPNASPSPATTGDHFRVAITPAQR